MKFSRIRIRPWLWFALVEAITVLVIAVIALRLWRYDLSVPINYWGDTLWFVSVIKGLVQNSWAFEIPQLSAPFTLNAAAFPAMTNFDWGVMKGIALIVPDAGIVLNVFWLLSLVFTAWSASLTLHLLGVRSWLALQGGVLYAFLPFALMRNTAHINLVYFCVPLLCFLSVYIIQGKIDNVSDTTARRIGYSACLIQGFDYIYFSFFSVLLFVMAGVLAYTRRKQADTIKIVLTAIVIIIVATAVNLAPSFYSWHEHGKPPDMVYKSFAEAEVYGLKIRRLLVPHPENPVLPLRLWAQSDRDSKFLLENENAIARLGLFAGFGFLLLLLVSLNPGEGPVDNRLRTLRSIAALALFTLLISTVGGFGVIINFLVGPDIRCYNRFSVFLAFFAIAGLSIWIDGRIRTALRPKLLISCVLVFGVFSLYDQLLDGSPLVARQTADMQSASYEKAVVHQMEERLPKGAKVFQLPLTGFPGDGGLERMSAYDHARPNLWSQNLHWSWPSFSQKHQAWISKIDSLQGEALVRALVLSGFDAIWIDRFGYKDDGNTILQSLIGGGGVDLLPGASPRYVILDLRQAHTNLLQSLGKELFEAEAKELFSGFGMEWGKGFYGAEKNAEGHAFHWSRAKSTLVVRNFGSQARDVRLSFAIQSQGDGVVKIAYGTKYLDVQSSSVPSKTQVDFHLKPGQSETLEFVTNLPQVQVPGERRDLYFAVIDLKLSDGMLKQ